MTWVTPFVLIGMLGWWGFNQAWPIMTFETDPGGAEYSENALLYSKIARAMMISLFLFFAWLVLVAARRGRFRSLDNATEA